MSTTVTIQKRMNGMGEVRYRAYILVQDAIITGWGRTPDEAEKNLKEKCELVLMKNDPAFEEEVRKVMKGLPKSQKNEAVRIALDMKSSSNNQVK